MSQFIESICFKNGHYQLLELHQARVNQTFELKFPGLDPLNLKDLLPPLSERRLLKVRFIYSNENWEVDVHPYVIKKPASLQVVHDPEINYPLKDADRTHLNELFDKRGKADDVIIVKNDKITDSSYANLVFWDGSSWKTPASYLLNGVKRQYLLSQGLIEEMEIRISDIEAFKKIGLINAMLDLGEINVNIEGIKF